MSLKVSNIASIVNGICHGDEDAVVTSLASLENAGSGQLSFVSNDKFAKILPYTKAQVVLLTNAHVASCPVTSIIVDDPYVAYAKISKYFNNKPAAVNEIHASAVIDNLAIIGDNVAIGPNSVIKAGVTLGNNTVIGANCVVNENTTIGEGAKLHDNIVIYHSVIIGKMVEIHSGAIIGSDGFGLARDKDGWHKIYQLGRVVIHDHVDIGANTVIDRGAIDDTVIQQGAKLDNLIQVGHNVKIGKNTAIAGCVGIAGSSIIGDNCLLGGGVGIAGHNIIGDNVVITAFTGVKNNIKNPGIYSASFGSMEFAKWKKVSAHINRIEIYVEKIKKLEKKLQQLEYASEH